jgi:hypothetical protein
MPGYVQRYATRGMSEKGQIHMPTTQEVRAAIAKRDKHLEESLEKVYSLENYAFLTAVHDLKNIAKLTDGQGNLSIEGAASRSRPVIPIADSHSVSSACGFIYNNFCALNSEFEINIPANPMMSDIRNAFATGTLNKNSFDGAENEVVRLISSNVKAHVTDYTPQAPQAPKKQPGRLAKLFGR